jgi:septum formation protein
MEDKRNNQTNAPQPDALVTDLPKIVLASASPRRAEILRTVNWPFEALPMDIDETRQAGEDAAVYVQRLARAKAETAAQQHRGPLIVGADTTVVIGAEILEKPKDHDDARHMLRQLNGQWHQVLTGVALIDRTTGETQVACAKTQVKFARMSTAEIDWYVSTGEPMDKAGAYAIQGPGSRFIESIKGEYFNVVGLPVRLLYEMCTGIWADQQ